MKSQKACMCIEPDTIVILHAGHCCLDPETPHAEGWPPAPSCHPDEWRSKYGDNFPNQPELPKEFLDLMEKP